MRVRNVKNKKEILSSCNLFIPNPKDYHGKWKELFSNSSPIYIEIGMGKGKFIIENAKKYPHINFIGIEKQDSVLVKAVNKLDQEFDNLFFVHMNALELEEIFSKEIDRIYLNFSDPWPKVRHHFRRLTSKLFLDQYDQIFKDAKEIFLRTDNADLFTYSIESLSNNGYLLKNVSLDLHKDTNHFLITTEYEERFVKEGKPIFSLEAISLRCPK